MKGWLRRFVILMEAFRHERMTPNIRDALIILNGNIATPLPFSKHVPVGITGNQGETRVKFVLRLG